MLSGPAILLVFCAYMGALFAVAAWGSARRRAGHSLVDNPLVYSLSLAVYCSSWTFFGSVGLAAQSGMLFLAIYLGPCLVFLFLPRLAGRMIRLKSDQHITSIADFISARYEKSEALAMLVTLIALVGSVPYLALQIKAILDSFQVIAAPDPSGLNQDWLGPVVTAMMILFTIVFGVRRLDPTERHEGMVAAVAAESVVKLMAFLAVGGFVVWGMFGGLGRIWDLAPAAGPPTTGGGVTPLTWLCYLLLSANAILLLPRQFHIMVVEARGTRHLPWAMWLFPLYLLLINLFVHPLGQAGLALGLPLAQADTFLLRLPLLAGQQTLALLVFLGGFSAAASMVMICAMTMSTMIANHLVLPLVDWIPQLAVIERNLLKVRWLAVGLVILLGYHFEQQVGPGLHLARMGMISFAAILQLAPAALGGLWWRGGRKKGAAWGMLLGFAVWAYTLFLPAWFAGHPTWDAIGQRGPWGTAWLKPGALFGLEGLDPISHAVLWSLAANLAGYLLGSLIAPPPAETEAEGAREEPYRDRAPSLAGMDSARAGRARIPVEPKAAKALQLLGRYCEPAEAWRIQAKAQAAVGLMGRPTATVLELADYFQQIERHLAGSIGSATAHRVLSQAELFTPAEAEELREAYAQIFADLKANPQDLKRKIDYYRERETLIQRHASELEAQVGRLEREIALRQQAERRMKESEERYRLAIEHSSDGVVVIQGGEIYYVNRQLADIFGYQRRRELLGRPLGILVHPQDREMVDQRLFFDPTRPFAPCRFDFKGLRKDGAAIYLAVSAGAVRYQGQLLGLIYLRDVTRRRQTEEQVHLLSRRLIEGIEEERKRLAADLHDEFGQALTGLQLMVGTLMQSLPPDQTAQRQACGRLGAKIEAIADGARAIYNELRPEMLDHLGLVATAEWHLKECGQRDPDLEIEFQAVGFGQRKLDPTVEIALYRILQEAMHNVVKHAQAARASVRLTYSHPDVILVIKDDGRGFEPEPQPVSADLTSGGLGLLSMRERVAAVGGQLDLRSAPGRGTIIRVRVPGSPPAKPGSLQGDR